MVQAVDFRSAFRLQGCQHQGGGGPQVGGHDGGAAERFHSGNDGGAVIHLDVRPHALEFGAVHETLRENSILHHGDARRGGEESRHLGLHVRGVAGIRGSLDFSAFGRFPGNDGDRIPPLVEFHVVAALPEQIRHHSHVFLTHAPQGHAIPHHGRRHHKGAGLNAVRDNGMVAATELFHSLNDDPARSRTLNIGAHLD